MEFLFVDDTVAIIVKQFEGGTHLRLELIIVHDSELFAYFSELLLGFGTIRCTVNLIDLAQPLLHLLRNVNFPAALHGR